MLDADRQTLHVRCGSDIRDSLQTAGFGGDFLEYSDPLCQGPVPDSADLTAIRAGFLADAYGGFMQQTQDQLAARLQEADARVTTAHRYSRVVLWFEHDSYDQLVLARCLARLADGPLPACLELICIDRQPDIPRFIGLGQLSPAALTALWPSRTAVTPAQIGFGQTVWTALRQPDPSALLAIAATATPAMPFASAALRRHLQELPAAHDGLSLTQRLTLQVLSEQPSSVGRVYARLMQHLEPLPFLGDLMFLHVIQQMALTRPAVLTIEQGEAPFRRLATITPTGHDVLRGAIDFLSLDPPHRWVGGVRITSAQPAWRYSDAAMRLSRSGDET